MAVRGIKAALRNLLDATMLAAIGAVAIIWIASDCTPQLGEGFQSGFSTGVWDGTPEPATQYGFGILDASTGSFSQMCTQTTDPGFPAGETTLSQSGRDVYAFWYLTSYQFAIAPVAEGGCGLDLSWCGVPGAQCWGEINAFAFYDFMDGNADFCGQVQAGFADVELFDPSDPGKWTDGAVTERRTVVNAFLSHLEGLSLAGGCGKNLVGVYSNPNSWTVITEDATRQDVGSDWFWMSSYGPPPGSLEAQVQLVTESAQNGGLGMRLFSWQYGNRSGCQSGTYLDVLKQAAGVVSRIDLWADGDPSHLC